MTPKYSKVAVLTKIGQPLEIQDIPIPENLEPGAILAKVDAAAICGSDVHEVKGEIPGFNWDKDLPMIPGHEIAGTIVKLGPGVEVDSIGEPLKIGDRIVWSNSYCGHCYHCTITHNASLCTQRKPYGFQSPKKFPYIAGGYTEYAYVFPGSGRVKIPDNVTSDLASTATCALRTVVQGFDRIGPIGYTDTVVIQGAGPLGLYSTAMARWLGAARIITIGAPEGRLDVARKFGADSVISVLETDEDSRVKQILEMTKGGADIVIEMSGAKSAFPEGLKMVRAGGRYLNVGQGVEYHVSISPYSIMRKQLHIVGSFSGTIAHYWKALQFLSVAQSRFDLNQIISNRYPLEDVNLALKQMDSFKDTKAVLLP